MTVLESGRLDFCLFFIFIFFFGKRESEQSSPSKECDQKLASVPLDSPGLLQPQRWRDPRCLGRGLWGMAPEHLPACAVPTSPNALTITTALWNGHCRIQDRGAEKLDMH